MIEEYCRAGAGCVERWAGVGAHRGGDPVGVAGAGGGVEGVREGQTPGLRRVDALRHDVPPECARGGRGWKGIGGCP